MISIRLFSEPLARYSKLQSQNIDESDLSIQSIFIAYKYLAWKQTFQKISRNIFVKTIPSVLFEEVTFEPWNI